VNWAATLVSSTAALLLLLAAALLRGESPANGSTTLSVATTFSPGLSAGDVDAMTHQVRGVSAFSRMVTRTESVSAGGSSEQIEIQAVDPSYQRIENQHVVDGEYFSPDDSALTRGVAVLGQAANARLFPDQTSSVGQAIRIRNVTFTVLGVLARSGTDEDMTVLVPFQTGVVRLFGASSLDAVVFQVEPGQTQSVSAELRTLLRTRHELRPGQVDDFAFSTGTHTPDPNVVQQIVALSDQYACDVKGWCTSQEPPRFTS
jgi:putative ABC transport system permease protein